MEEIGRELGWEDSITQDSQEFTPLDPGDYDFTVEKYERGRSSGEGKLPPCNMAIVYFTVHGPEGRDVTIRENYILHTSMEWKLSQLFVGLGLKKKGETRRMNWNAVPGCKGKCRVGLQDGFKDPTKKFNRIEEIYPYIPPQYKAGTF